MTLYAPLDTARLPPRPVIQRVEEPENLGTYHTMILGTTGQVKRVLLQTEAQVACGFSATNVRERTYECAEQNKQAALKATKAE